MYKKRLMHVQDCCFAFTLILLKFSLPSASLDLIKSLIADRRVLSNDSRNNCGTHFGFGPLLVSKVTNDERFRILLYLTHGNKIIVLSIPIYARYRLRGIFRQKTPLHQPRRSRFIYIFGVTIKHSLAQASLAYVAGVRKERELGRETTCEGGVIPCLSRARAQIPPSPPFSFPF